MYGIFTYIHCMLPLKPTKCRYIYHTRTVWDLYFDFASSYFVIHFQHPILHCFVTAISFPAPPKKTIPRKQVPLKPGTVAQKNGTPGFSFKQGEPLRLINGLITPYQIAENTSVTGVILLLHRSYFTPFITIIGAHLVSWDNWMYPYQRISYGKSLYKPYFSWEFYGL